MTLKHHIISYITLSIVEVTSDHLMAQGIVRLFTVTAHTGIITILDTHYVSLRCIQTITPQGYAS